MHLGMPYTVIRTLPTAYRKWFVERLCRHFEERSNAVKRASEGEVLPMGEMPTGKLKF